jgi:hypothetical protein
MFMLDNKPLAIDTPFTHNEIQYPANWLRLASMEEKTAIGITEVSDPVRADDRFYWDGDINNPKPVEYIRNMLIDQIRQTAYTMLLPTDWLIVRQFETGQKPSQSDLDKRAAIRTAHESNLSAINAATDVPTMAALQFTWPTEDINV